MNIGFDIISDLNITGHDEFDWAGKPTSLYCIVAGNVSSDMLTLLKVIKNLSKYYQGVFFIDGTLENPDIHFRDSRVKELTKICNAIPNVVYLHTNVVVVEGVALVGINGWEEAASVNSELDIFQAKANRYDDITYLERTLERLQLHVDVKKIIVISNCIPSKELYFGSYKGYDELFPANTLYTDTEEKISKWVFGTGDKMVDTEFYGVKFVNNPKHEKNPYYPKRIDFEI